VGDGRACARKGFRKVGIATLEKGVDESALRASSATRELRLAELASLLSGCPIAKAVVAVRSTRTDDALMKVASALCANGMHPADDPAHAASMLAVM
jgi:hypothetical protein